MPTPGTTAQRGYGTEHQRLRRAWAPLVAAGGVDCARCGKPIRPGAAWDLGHVDGSSKRLWRGPEHASCNRSTGGRRPAGDPSPRPHTRW